MNAQHHYIPTFRMPRESDYAFLTEKSQYSNVQNFLRKSGAFKNGVAATWYKFIDRNPLYSIYLLCDSGLQNGAGAVSNFYNPKVEIAELKAQICHDGYISTPSLDIFNSNFLPNHQETTPTPPKDALDTLGLRKIRLSKDKKEHILNKDMTNLGRNEVHFPWRNEELAPTAELINGLDKLQNLARSKIVVKESLQEILPPTTDFKVNSQNTALASNEADADPKHKVRKTANASASAIKVTKTMAIIKEQKNKAERNAERSAERNVEFNAPQDNAQSLKFGPKFQDISTLNQDSKSANTQHKVITAIEIHPLLTLASSLSIETLFNDQDWFKANEWWLKPQEKLNKEHLAQKVSALTQHFSANEILKVLSTSKIKAANEDDALEFLEPVFDRQMEVEKQKFSYNVRVVLNSFKDKNNKSIFSHKEQRVLVNFLSKFALERTAKSQKDSSFNHVMAATCYQKPALSDIVRDIKTHSAFINKPYANDLLKSLNNIKSLCDESSETKLKSFYKVFMQEHEERAQLLNADAKSPLFYEAQDKALFDNSSYDTKSLAHLTTIKSDFVSNLNAQYDLKLRQNQSQGIALTDLSKAILKAKLPEIFKEKELSSTSNADSAAATKAACQAASAAGTACSVSAQANAAQSTAKAKSKKKGKAQCGSYKLSREERRQILSLVAKEASKSKGQNAYFRPKCLSDGLSLEALALGNKTELSNYFVSNNFATNSFVTAKGNAQRLEAARNSHTSHQTALLKDAVPSNLEVQKDAS